MTCWYDPIPGQAVIGLASDDRYLYFSTGGDANGLPAKSEPFAFVVWDPTGKEVWRKRFPEGVTLGRVTAVGHRVLLEVDAGIAVFNPDVMAFERSLDMGEPCEYVVPLQVKDTGAHGDAAVFGQSALWRLNALTGDVARLCDLPGKITSACVVASGDLYFASGTALYRCVDLDG